MTNRAPFGLVPIVLGETTVTSAKRNRAVGLFPDRPSTASAIQALQDGGFSPRRMSIIARNADRQEAIAGIPLQGRVTHRAGQGAAVLGVTGGILGGITGLLLGLGIVSIPGITPWIEANPELTAAGEAKPALTALGGAAAGGVAGALLGVLVGLAIPHDRAREHRDRIESGDYVLMLQSQDAEFHRARTVLRRLGNRESDITGIPLLPPPQSPPTQLEVPDSRRASPIPTTTVLPQPLPLPDAHPQTVIQSESGVPLPARAEGFPGEAEVASPAHPPIASPVASMPHTSGSQPGLAVEGTPRRLPPPPPPSHLSAHRPPRPPQRPALKLEKRAIALFPDAVAMERALGALRKSNFPMHHLSLLVADASQGDTPLEKHLNGNSEATVTAAPGTLSSITGLMVGLQSIAIPGVGRFFIVGAEASSIITALDGPESPSLLTVFRSLGIPETEARLYGDRLIHGASLATVKGSGDDVLQLTSTLHQQGIQDWSIYEIRPPAPGQEVRGRGS